MDDLELLRRFEPIIHFTAGEHFFPMDVDRYVGECSLWETPPGQPAELLISERDLTLQKLIAPRPAPHGAVHYLRFVESFSAFEAARYFAKQHREFEHSRGRLARVGLASRLVDALFTITLVMRGRVPGGTAAAAREAYEKLQQKEERYVYYGRVVRQGGFICLQYWFFYAMNDWRSSFHGVNDHEADWEQIVVYLAEDLTPQWVAYASHDFSGDDLRRRWDDPELKRVGEHPIIFTGAGSHASYFSAGEYMHEVALPFSGPFTRVMRALQRLWRNVFQQVSVASEETVSGALVIPFIDYARGDGLKIGLGGHKQWEARLLPDTHQASPDHPQAWAHHYRGLWGLFARDPIAGENAPAGPKYNRDGSVRRSWIDPLGWAGLDKVTPPSKVAAAISEGKDAIARRLTEAEGEIAYKTAQLRILGLEAESILNASHFESLYPEHLKKMKELSEAIEVLHHQTAADHALLEALEQYGAELMRGHRLPARSHIKMAHHPAPAEAEHLGRLAEAWAALSLGFLILGFILILLFVPRFWVNGLVSLAAVISFLEAIFRREAKELVRRVVVILSLIATLVLVVEFALPLLVLGIVGLGVFIIVDNLRELVG
jgi:hypothetical protein